jgi:hypothetical protein
VWPSLWVPTVSTLLSSCVDGHSGSQLDGPGCLSIAFPHLDFVYLACSCCSLSPSTANLYPAEHSCSFETTEELYIGFGAATCQLAGANLLTSPLAGLTQELHEPQVCKTAAQAGAPLRAGSSRVHFGVRGADHMLM